MGKMLMNASNVICEVKDNVRSAFAVHGEPEKVSAMAELLKDMGMLNTYSAIALPTCGAFGVLLIYSFMKGVPDELLEAADLDDCSEFRKFFSIVLPLIKTVLISLAIFTFISVWGSLVLPLIVATEPKLTPLTLAIANMKSSHTATNYGFIMAGNTIAFLPPFILYLFLQKQFVEGIALSGTKG